MTGSTLAAVDHGTAATGTLDEARVEAFAGHLFELYTGGMLTFMIDIGHRTGLFAATAAGPATSAELAARADLQERYVREWLGAMVTGGIVEHDPAAGTYRLPAEHAACLTGPGPGTLAPFSRLDTHLAKHVDAIARAFREGGGVPYAEFRPEFTDVMDALGRGVFDELLVEAYLPLVPGLGARLAAGARVSEAAGLGDARFEVRDAAGLTSRSPSTSCSCSTPSTTSWTRPRSWPGSTPSSPPAGPWSWSSPGPPATWPGTWPTRWPRCCTR
jgi:hypothetical protein